MNAIVKDVQKQTSLTTVDRGALITTLQNSLYVGATPESVGMVISYCEATGLDPMQKPVHIVPMWNKKLNRNIDVIMPGIGLYRIQADRSKTLAGTSEPTFGKNITQTFKGYEGEDVEVTYPEWCKVTMKKIVGNHIVEFTAKEYWIENYATAGKTTAPNAMWKKRPKGQLAKCAEAQALRKGWPEIGQSPTAEEMEGKVIDMGNADVVSSSNEAVTTKQTILPVYPDDKFEANKNTWFAMFKENKSSPDHIIGMIQNDYTLTDDQLKEIRGEK